MKSVLPIILVAGAAAEITESNPLGKVVDLMNGLAAKVQNDGEAEEKAYKEYFAWCDDVANNKQNEITTAKNTKAKLEATIEELTANIEASSSKISDLASSIATSNSDLTSATSIREKEAADFAASEKDLVDAVDTLGRAVTILEREMQKNPAALAQVSDAGLSGVIQAISTVIDGAAMNVADKQKLVALVQSQQGEDDDVAELGAPAAATYKTHSTGIFDILEDLKEKAEAQLSDVRKAEKTAAHNFAMLKQSLTDQLTADNKDMAQEKSAKAASEQSKATNDGDLAQTVADLKGSNEALATASSSCMTVAADHEATVRARSAELKVIAEAIDILKASTSGAVGQTYSFIQIQSHSDLARSEVVALVKKLARQHHSAALAQLASRISAVVRYGAGDPFAKVKGLIQDMIAKLQAEADSEATEKAYCDEELAKTAAKSSELNSEISALSTKIDQAAAKSASLKADVKELQAELAKMAEEQASRETWRQDEHAAYVQAKADLEQGLAGVRGALSLLRDYYQGASALVQQPAMPETHAASTGAGDSIIGLLEVCESDFASNLAKVETEEADSQETYERLSQENKIDKAMKDQDVKYKTQEFTTLDKTISELSSDRVTANTELSAVMEYYGKLKDRCIAKPETYEERKGRRDAEITGLKEALSILENEAALVQKGARALRRGRHLRLGPQ